MSTPGFRLVGARVPRPDARDQVHGLLRYADDFALAGMLHAKVVRATRPSAPIVRLDTRRAEVLPGVKCVMTARDVPHNVLFSDVPGQTTTIGPLRARTQVLADDVVRYLGEAVALVAAETEEAAEEAARLVTVEYEDLPGVFDSEDAMRPGAPQLEPTGNVISRWKIRQGDVEAGFREADVIVEETYHTGLIDHAFIEPEAGVGWLDENGVITLRIATQVIEDFRDVANVLGLPHSKVRIIAPYIGGGFGGREDVTVEIFLGLLVWKTTRPVRLCYSREESILSPTKRHPFVMKHKHGAKRDGTLVALAVELISDACARSHRPRSVFAIYQAPAGQVMDFETGQGKVFPDFTFGSQAVEVEVDPDTGEVEVRRLAACYDVGRAINRSSVEGQIEGGAAMGIGYALLEEDKVASGVTVTPNLMTYLIPTALDVPDITSIVLESGEGMGPWGARGIGEPALVPTAPAIANALVDAVGARLTRLPVTRERLWQAMQAGKTRDPRQ